MPRIDAGDRRNEQCPCNSGLKLKHCHGDVALKRDCSNIANGMLLLFIMQRRVNKGKATPEEATAFIDKVAREVDAMLPECVRMETNYEVKEEEPVVDKLAEKEKAGGSCLDDIQKDMVVCGCGRRLPAGMECMKCKKGKETS